MDLFDCPKCKKRFIVGDAGSGRGWSCPACGSSLNLVVRRLPGSAEAVARALHAQVIDDVHAH